LQPGHSRHGDVEDGEVDRVALRRRDRFGARGGFGHHGEVRLCLEHHP
jgi:hypothetical protein